MKKLIALLLAVLMLASILVACNGGGGETPKTDDNQGGSDTSEDPFYGEDNIKLLVWAADKAVDLTKKLCDDFKAQYPDKTIDIEVQVQGEGDAAANVLNDADAAADVFSFACDQLNRLCRANALAPVFDIEDVTARNSEASVNAGTIDGVLYAFPETGDNGYYLVYDKSVVSDEQAKTLEGVFEACKAANKKVVIDAGNGFFSCMFPFTGGLEITGLDDEGTQMFNDYNEDEVVDTLVAFAELFHKYEDIFMSAEATRISSGMAESPRTVGAGIDGSWNAVAVAEALGDDFGAAKLPTIGGKQIISMHGYKLIGVNSHSKFPNSAQLLADFLTNEDSQLARAKELSWGPSNTKAVADASVTDNVALAAIIDQSAYSVPQVSIADTFWTPMGTLGNKLWKEKAYDKDTIKAEFDKAIANIKDE